MESSLVSNSPRTVPKGFEEEGRGWAGGLKKKGVGDETTPLKKFNHH